MKAMDFEKKYYDLLQWVQGMGQYFNDWDKVCDCGADKGIHTEDCITSKIRKDLSKYDE